MSHFSVIGKPIAMIDAAGKTTGAGKYADDFRMPGMLVARFSIRRIRMPASRALIRPAPRHLRGWLR